MRCRFQNVLATVPFSTCTVFKICRQKCAAFRVNWRLIRNEFHSIQNVSVSCESHDIFIHEVELSNFHDSDRGSDATQLNRLNVLKYP